MIMQSPTTQHAVFVEDKNNELLSNLVSVISSVMDAMEKAIPKNIEVVLHDLTHPDTSVIKIINGEITARKRGDSLLKAPDNNDGFAGMLLKDRDRLNPFILSGYNCVINTGEVVKSGSSTFYNDNGEPIAAFAINVLV